MTLKDYEILKNIVVENDDYIGVTMKNGSSIKDVMSRCNNISYNKIYLTLLKFKNDGLVTNGLSRGREKTYILTDKGIEMLKEIVGEVY